MDMLKINKASSEGKCPKCTHYQKQNARLKKDFIKADDQKCAMYRTADEISDQITTVHIHMSNLRR